ncbi:hypothetical protein FNV43_RR10922 [Rhamnella rubrinervis]|uniref:Uncharacterized protein n=1 Tax=Rhamnella rubrinervis TaxID=2594499 RepID=A0A8K0MHD2_9ROSA|nr:hypothetical protein FNV43_RR10922 [Rhamnella rubrinervis]
MSSSSTQFATAREMGIYEPFRQVSMWKDTFGSDNDSYMGPSTIGEADARMENKFGYILHESIQPSGNEEEGNKPSEKAQRRLAQNREAARKSRLRKKAYVQQLETSRLKLAQLEQELERSRKQGVYAGSPLGTSHVGFSGTVSSGIMAFEMEYGHWVEEQHKQNCELRNALQAHATDIELRMLVESSLNHYYSLFRMKADAAKADVFYLISGVWRTSAERFFLWIGGFRPSELLNVLLPQIEPLTDQQHVDVGNLQHSSQQAEDALSQGIDKLQQSLYHAMAADPMNGDNFGTQMAAAVEKLDELESFVSQADHLRQQTLRRMSCILTTQQAAREPIDFVDVFNIEKLSPNQQSQKAAEVTKTLSFSEGVILSSVRNRYEQSENCLHQARSRVSFRNSDYKSRLSPTSFFSSRYDSLGSKGTESWFRVHQRRTLVRATDWSDQKSPYETLELERDADEEEVKIAYRRLAKFYHPDVYDGKGSLEEGETAEARFIKIQAAYELLIDEEKRMQYDKDNRVNPMKASEAWMEWLIKKRKAFDQRGDMAIAAWAEQQQREMNLRARRLSRSKVDPEEEKRILAKERKASKEYFSSTLKRHTLVLKKRDLLRRKAEEEKRKVINQLLAAEGLELDTDDEEVR